MVVDAPVRESTLPGGSREEFDLGRVSVVVPVLDEAGSLPRLHQELTDALQAIGIPYEIIYVDDGSRDGSTQLLVSLFERDDAVQIIQFRRNFGKSAALSAGFQSATGDAIVTLDADLQDDPGQIPRLLDELVDDADLVSGWKHPRRDPLSKRLPSNVFNRVVRLFTGVPLHDFNCGFKAYRAEVVRELPLYGELHRYIPVLAHNRGFRVAEVTVEHRPRMHGRSKYGGARFARGFFDLLTVLFLTQYTRRPLHLFGWFGVTTLLVGFLINAYLATLWFMGQPIGHRPLLSLGLLLMIIGAQFFVFGLLAEMIASSTTVKPDYSVRRHMRHDPGRDDHGA
jgi:glycosyltransferase involved in cell wall biosynthesis